MLEFIPDTKWINVSQRAYDATTAGHTTVQNKPVVERGTNRTVRVCNSHTANKNCLHCSEALSCPVGKLAIAIKS